jgi:alkaline phosphatase
VQLAKDKTNPRNTLIIVTADHSHVFTIAGYPKRGNPILGKVVEPDKTDLAHDQLGLPYTTLSYANGPGYTGESHDAMRQAMIPSGPKSFPHQPDRFSGITSGRSDLTIVDTTNPQYLQEATVPLPMETHGGEDVAIFATGPQSHLFHGVQEQNVIAHVIMNALRLRPRQ